MKARQVHRRVTQINRKEQQIARIVKRMKGNVKPMNMKVTKANAEEINQIDEHNKWKVNSLKR